MKRNLNIIYATSALLWGRFYLPVLALFYIASAVTIEQFGIILAGFSLTVLLLEVPSGVIADLLGKKQALIIARTCYLLELLLLAYTNGFWPLLTASIIAGVGVSLSSGTDSSLLYDTLRRSFKEHRHQEIKGKTDAIKYLVQGAVFITGAALFTIDPKLPAKLSLPFIALALILTFLLKEPYKVRRHVALAGMGRHFTEGVAYFRRHKHVQYLVFYTMPLAAAFTITHLLSSPYLERVKMPVASIGVIALLASLIAGYSSKNAHRFEKGLGEKRSLHLVPIGVITGLFLMGLSLPYVSVILYLFIALIQGFFLVVTDDYVHKHIVSSHRATVMSIKNMFTHFGIIVLLPAVAGFAGIGIGVSLIVLALVLTAYGSLFYLLFEKQRF